MGPNIERFSEVGRLIQQSLVMGKFIQKFQSKYRLTMKYSKADLQEEACDVY